MEKINFSIFINAPKEKVWNTMLDDATYRQWTKAFNEGSYYDGNWEEGSHMKFLGPDPRDSSKIGGMYSVVKENKLNEFISLEHIGVINDGVTDTESEEMKNWIGAHENYTFTESEGGTTVSVDVDVYAPYKSEFEKMWPKALESLKELAEK